MGLWERGEVKPLEFAFGMLPAFDGDSQGLQGEPPAGCVFGQGLDGVGGGEGGGGR